MNELINLSYHLHSFSFFGVTYSWTHTVHSLFRLASFTSQYAFKLSPCLLWLDSAFLLHAEEYSIIWVYRKLFIHSPIEKCLGCFQGLAIMNKAATNILMQGFFFFWWMCFQLMGRYQRVWLLDHILSVMFSFVRNHPIAFPSGHTIFHSHQQWGRVLPSLHPYQHLVLSAFWILAILGGGMYLVGWRGGYF